MKLLIDCDYIVYKCCAATETEIDFGEDLIVVTSNFTDALNCVEKELKKIKDEFGSFVDIIIFFTSPDNFRKKMGLGLQNHVQNYYEFFKNYKLS